MRGMAMALAVLAGGTGVAGLLDAGAAAAQAGAPAASWNTVGERSLGFTAQMPGKPVRDEKAASDNSAASTSFALDQGNQFFLISVLEAGTSLTDEQAANLLNKAADGGVRGGNGTETSRRMLTVDGARAIEVSFDSILGGKTMKSLVRLIWANERLYTVLVVREAEVDPAAARRAVDSFRLAK